jgi:hypothetical protein
MEKIPWLKAGSDSARQKTTTYGPWESIVVSTRARHWYMVRGQWIQLSPRVNPNDPLQILPIQTQGSPQYFNPSLWITDKYGREWMLLSFGIQSHVNRRFGGTSHLLIQRWKSSGKKWACSNWLDNWEFSYASPKRRFTYRLNGATSQKTTTFETTAAITSDPQYM